MTRRRKTVVPIHQFVEPVRKCKGCGYIAPKGQENNYHLGVHKCELFGGFWCDGCHENLHHKNGKLY